MNPLLLLADHGQSYWIDNLTRDMLESGGLARRVADEGLRGVTANPAIFQKAIAGSDAYDADIRVAARAGRSAPEIYELLATTDVRRACDVLGSVYDATDGTDGFVSLEVSPHLARNESASIDEARRLWAAVDRPNLMIKIPATVEGLPVIEELLCEGVNVNITLLFAVERYEAVAEAYLRALERRLAAGQSLAGIASVASFFLSRIDTLVDQLLAHRTAPDGSSQYEPHPKTLQGHIGIASAKLAYRSLTKLLASERWQRLAEKGARPQRLLWASTSTKNPAYGDLMYVGPLIGPQTVNTMTEATIAAFADHGQVRDSVRKGIREAARSIRALKALNINLKQVTDQLENEGIEKFIRPYDQLLDALETQRKRGGGGEAGDLAPLADAAAGLRRDAIRMTTAAGSGHPTSCMSAAEIVAALFFREMRWDPGDPAARDVDTFILSKGHAAPVLWAALKAAGAIDEDLATLRQVDSTLEGHPTPNNPWVRVATGSLGQGLAAANGIALANRLDGIDARVYCLLGDGECSEGSVWEAAQFASLQKLANVVAIVDENGFGQSGAAPYDHDTGVFAARFRAFGWNAIEIDGHDLGQVVGALAAAAERGPTAIIARTVKGKGVSFLAGKDGWHGKVLDRVQKEQALAELPEPQSEPQIEPRRVGRSRRPAQRSSDELQVDYARGDEVATRDAFGAALRKLGELNPDVVALDGDVKDSTRTSAFAKAFPDRFFESYIAEQNMVGAALGLAASGKIPYAATFACFLTRAADFIRMAGHSRPEHLVLCGSHAGISIGEDGPSQMGLEDLALFRAMNGSTVLYPSDAVSAERLTGVAARTPGIVYLRTTRPKTPVIYESAENFEVGGSKTLRSSADDRATIVAAGITVHEALAAHDELARAGVPVRVIDAYSVKPLDVETLERAARDTGHIVVVEDHWIDGGLGDAVAAALDTPAAVRRLAVSKEPRSGSPEALLDRYGISRRAIEQAVMEMAGAS